MDCQPPLQRRGTFSLEKKRVLYSCRDRQDGSPVESVPRLAEEAMWAGEPNAPATGKRGVGGGVGAEGGFISAAMPPPRLRRGARTCMGMRPSRVPGSQVPPTAVHRAREGRQLDQCPSPALRLSSFLSVHHSFLSLLLRPRRGKRKPLENLALSSLIPCPSMVPSENGHPTASSCSSSQSPVWGFCSSQEIVIHRACFFAKCNYPRPCVYGRGMVESNRK